MKLFRVFFKRRAAVTGDPLTTTVRACSAQAARLIAEKLFPEIGKTTKAVIL